MAELSLRNLVDRVVAELRRRAAMHGCSVVPEAHAILRDGVAVETEQEPGLGTRIAARFAGIGLRDGEGISELRGYAPKPATFD